MHRPTLNRLLFTALGGVIVFLTIALTREPQLWVALSCGTFFCIAVVLYRFDYLHPAVAYVVPWLLILIFSVIPISEHARAMDETTYVVLFATIFAWLFGCVGISGINAPRIALPAINPRITLLSEIRSTFRPTFITSFAVLYIFAAINVAVAGYVPLISLLTTGNSRYDEFGVPSVYGAFLSYANAVGCLAFYVYIRGGGRKYLYLFISVFLMHLALVTRQNALTLLVEAFVIRCLSTKRTSQFTIVWSIAAVLVGFSALGTLRSGDIREVIGVQQEFYWVPTSLIWLYAYSYFNALNIDNMIAASGAPYFDGYMWQTILPSMFRTNIDHGTYLELSSMTVSSYILPVYIDIGNAVVVWTLVMSLLTAFSYRRATQNPCFITVSTYSCLYFCALMSFFTNFWLYLPVIFQLAFFWIFHKLMFKQYRGAAPVPAFGDAN